MMMQSRRLVDLWPKRGSGSRSGSGSDSRRPLPSPWTSVFLAWMNLSGFWIGASDRKCLQARYPRI